LVAKLFFGFGKLIEEREAQESSFVDCAEAILTIYLYVGARIVEEKRRFGNP
jgi:hypothetical protein